MLKKSFILASLLASLSFAGQAHEHQKAQVEAYPMLSECGDDVATKSYPMLSEDGQESQAKVYPMLGEEGQVDLHQHAPWR